jgi:hypothetical protein
VGRAAGEGGDGVREVGEGDKGVGDGAGGVESGAGTRKWAEREGLAGEPPSGARRT